MQKGNRLYNLRSLWQASGTAVRAHTLRSSDLFLFDSNADQASCKPAGPSLMSLATGSHASLLGHHFALCPHARATVPARLPAKLRRPLRPACRWITKPRDIPVSQCQHGTRARAEHAEIKTPPAPALKFHAAFCLSITSSGWLHGPLAAARACWASAYAVLQWPIQASPNRLHWLLILRPICAVISYPLLLPNLPYILVHVEANHYRFTRVWLTTLLIH